MYKLLHIHHEIIFVGDTLKFIDARFENEVIFIGSSDDNKTAKLDKLGIGYRVFENTPQNLKLIANYAEKYDGVIFYCLEDTKIQILMNLNLKIKAFARFFGFELYNLCMDQYLSDKTLGVMPEKKKAKSNLKVLYHKVKRWLKIVLNKEYSINSDNQKTIYKRLDAIFVVNRFEYQELKELFYLPKLIELQFTNHENEVHEFKVIKEKLNQIIVGNNGSEVNNHIDVFEIIGRSNIKEKVEFNLFFSYGNKRSYSEVVRTLARGMKNVNLIENFLAKQEFETIYESAAALVINSYRQNALGNVFTAIKVGCKIYLNKRSSTYKWLIAEGFLISELEDLKHDLESGNFKLSAEQQQRNIDCFIASMKRYSVNDFLNKVIDTLNEKK
jgi:dTDP-N-acetylfucosamine:lipid II N-acetylfucosaminyltransferase